MPDQKEVWNSVGEEWHKYRQHPVSEATEFLKNKRGLILDLACGSGRNFVKIDGAIIGVDFSERMLRFARANITKNRYNDVFLVNANAEKLPFQDGVFDTVMLSASLHNIKYNRHRNVLEEINRVSKNKADIFISVWNRDQPRFANAERESYIPWKSKGKTYQRYYYLYTKDELQALLRKYFKNVKVFYGREKAFKKYSKNIIAIAKVRKPKEK